MEVVQLIFYYVFKIKIVMISKVKYQLLTLNVLAISGVS